VPIAERLPAADFVARELVVDKRAALTAETSSRVRSRRSGEKVVLSLANWSICSDEVLGVDRGQSQQSGMELGCVAVIDSNGRRIFVADAHRDDRKRFIVRADEKLTAFVELEAAIRQLLGACLTTRRDFSKLGVAKRI